ncbi:MAG TPA: hypothetical protein PLG43_01030 [Spirochaetia bacterium]|jgi:hypothetical protein|nr:hypothetical protein [Spirochaetia bacterium]
MLGISDASVLFAYVLLFISIAGCIVYGLVNWNREGKKKSTFDAEKESQWLKKENEIKDKVSESR